MTTLHLRKSIGRSSLRRGFLLIPLALACFALLPIAQAANETTSNANTAEGFGALQSVSTGSNNTALGAGALFSLTTGVQNTATGAQALKNNTANGNTADGFQALVKNTMGDDNTATGWRALFQNTTGNLNTATGSGALYNNTADRNTAMGAGALFFNNGGPSNTAVGVQALANNTDGNGNTAVGDTALVTNTHGTQNTAVGWKALSSNTIGLNNTAVGQAALSSETSGFSNVAIGQDAGDNLTTGNDNIDIFDGGVAGESDTIRIGTQGTQNKTFIAGISGVDEGGTISTVYINTSGQLGTTAPASSRRFKKKIQPMDQTSEAILGLKPVTFQYKSDAKGTPQFGLIAEEVAAVNPDLVVRDKNGDIYSVRYDAVNAMLLNEFLKEHRKVRQQDATIADLKSTVAEQQKQIKALASGLQKVSAQLEVSKAAPQTVGNNQ